MALRNFTQQNNNATGGGAIFQRPGIVGNHGSVVVKITDFVTLPGGVPAIKGIPISFPEEKQKEHLFRYQSVDEMVNDKGYKLRNRGLSEGEKAEIRDKAVQTFNNREEKASIHSFNDPSHNNFTGIGGLVLFEQTLERLTQSQDTVFLPRWGRFLAKPEQIADGTKEVKIGVQLRVSGTDDFEHPRRRITVASPEEAQLIKSAEDFRTHVSRIIDAGSNVVLRLSDDTEAQGVVIDNFQRDNEGQLVIEEDRVNTLPTREVVDGFLAQYQDFLAQAFQDNSVSVEVFPITGYSVGSSTATEVASGSAKMRLADYEMAADVEKFGPIMYSNEGHFGFRRSVLVLTRIEGETGETFQLATTSYPVGTGYKAHPLGNLPTPHVNPFDILRAQGRIRGGNETVQQSATPNQSGTQTTAQGNGQAVQRQVQNGAQQQTAQEEGIEDIGSEIDKILESDSAMQL